MKLDQVFYPNGVSASIVTKKIVIKCSFLFSCWPPVVLMLVCEGAVCIWSSHKVAFNEREDSPQTKLLVDHKPSMTT